MIRRTFLSFIIVVALFSGAQMALAQIPGVSDVTVVVSPLNPGPLQDVTITVKSYAFNIQAADVEWSVDGKAAGGGVGSDSYTIMTKDVGTPTNVTVTVTAIGNAPAIKNITITPMSVDLLWQATDSIVPPLYRGKAMPTSESAVKFVAIPQVKSQGGVLLGSQNFLYGWSENYTGKQNDSGYGKDSYTTTMDYLNPTKHIDVDAGTRDGAIDTSAHIDLTPILPKLAWYASSPLYGPEFDHMLSGTYVVAGSDTSIIAEPYFFSPANPADPTLAYVWTLNGQPLTTPPIPNSLFLHRGTSATGIAELDLSVTNLARLFQESTGRLTLSLQ